MTLEQIKKAALESTTCPKFAIGEINGRQIECFVAHGFRNTGKDSVRWKVDGKVVSKSEIKNIIG